MMANQPPPQPASGHPLRRTRAVLIVFISLCLVFVASYTGRLLTKGSIESEVREMQAKIDAEKQEQLVLKAELVYVATDDYVDEVARNELHLVKEGDTVVVVLDSTPMVPTPQPEVELQPKAEVPSTPNSSETPIWQQWFSILAPAQ